MAYLKGVIFGVDNILARGQNSTSTAPPQRDEIVRLLKFLISKNVTPVVLSNRDWTTDKGTKKLDDKFNQLVGQPIRWFIKDRHGTPSKPQSAAIQNILTQMGWQPREVIYVGNSDMDMRTAVNSNILFLNALWYQTNSQYGIKIKSPAEVARFVDVFCLRNHLWHYKIESNGLRVYALGTYGTMEQRYQRITTSAREAAKFGRGRPDFWINYLLSTAYFAGLHEEIDYIASYPSSSQGAAPSIIYETVDTFAKCFRKKYLPDLIVRHTSSTKSAYARASGGSVDQLNQLNSIVLTQHPMKSATERFKSTPLRGDRTILVIDDFCTQGFSFEAARRYIEQAGSRVICLSLLKTILRGYEEITALQPARRFDPYAPNTFTSCQRVIHPYNAGVCDPGAHDEVGDKLDLYDAWTWPI